MKNRCSHFLSWMLLFPLLSLVVTQSCTDPPEFPESPQISFNSYSTNKFSYDTLPIHVNGSLDTVFLKLNFTDGDGDIGYSAPDTANCDFCAWEGGTSCINHPTRDLYLFDLRDSCLTAFNMPVIEETNSNGSVQGIVNIDVFSICCKLNTTFPCVPTSTPAVDTLIYEVVMRDKAFHFSNRIRLPPIYVHCDI